MKVGDIHHSNKTVSGNVHDPIREQLDSLTSMIYTMSIQKEENNRPFKPQIHQRKRRRQNKQNFGNRDRNRSYSRDKDKTFRDSLKADNVDVIVAEEVRQNYRRNFSNDRYDNRERSRTRERSLTPRRNDSRIRDSPNANLGTANRSNSKVTTNRDRIRCYRYREYDHFANKCPNTVTDDLDGYESDKAAL